MAGPVRTLIATRRRTAELGLGIVAILITVAGYLLLSLSKAPALPADFWGFLLFVVGLFFVAHVAIRRFAPNADPTLLPLVTLLNGIGFTMISRLDLAVGPAGHGAHLGDAPVAHQDVRHAARPVGHDLGVAEEQGSHAPIQHRRRP